MLQTFFSRLGWFILLFFLQTLVFNHIHLFGIATPMPYVYFLLILPSVTPRWVFIIAGFALGMGIDLFTDTPGMGSASLCLCGFLSPCLLRLFTPADKEDEELQPSSHSMKWGGFLGYALSLVLIHCLIFFTIEAFSFNDWQTLFAKIAGSAAFTLLIIVILEMMRSRKSE